ncbi:hypothetical protein BGW41_003005 [Actinomortierella wolfii]|nr:hypothetical protein BGW41_003005 [Actinomortierella wolfii]
MKNAVTTRRLAFVPPTEEIQTQTRHHSLPRRRLRLYALHIIFTFVQLVNHQVLAQSTDHNHDGHVHIGRDPTSPGLPDHRQHTDGDGTRNGRWGGGGRRRRRLSRAAVIGICIGVAVVIIGLMVLIIWFHRRRLRKKQGVASENSIDRSSSINGIKVETSGDLPPASPTSSSPHPLLLPSSGGTNDGSDNPPTRHSNSFQRLSRYGSTKWKEFRQFSNRDKPTPVAPKSKKQAAHISPLYTPPTFDSFEDQDEVDEDPASGSATPPPSRLPEVRAGSKEELTLTLDPPTSIHIPSPESANTSMLTFGGVASPCEIHWSPASSSSIPVYQTHQQQRSPPDSPSIQIASRSLYHDTSSGYRG